MDINSTSNICTVYDTFDFSKFILTHPESLQGGSFFTKLNINNDILYVQTPKCISKQGIVSSSGKKSYIDLMFSVDDSKFIEFMENLEKSCVEKIHEKKNSWFTNDIDQNDIENAFTATLRPYKAGKYYLLRANIAPSKNLVKMPTCFVFDESENKLTLDDIKPENDLITVLEIQGIKFTSKSFQFEIILRQALIMSNKPVFQSCVIKKNILPPSTAPAPAPVPAPAQEHAAISLEISGVSQTIHTTPDNDAQQLQEQTQESLHRIEPHTENNLEKILNAKSNIKFNLENQDDIDDDDNNDDDNNDDIVNDNLKDIHINDDKNKSETTDAVNTGSKNTNNAVLKNNSLSESNVKNGSNNLEKIESLELNELTELTEADLEIKNDENLKLKKPNDIYYEIYSVAKEKARTARKLAFDAYLEVKKIKKTYMLDDSDSDFSNSSSSENSDTEEELESD
jgi:hypothetical protein